MKALSVIFVLLLACSLSHAETSQPVPELIVTVGEVEYTPSSPAHDSVIVPVYVENLIEPICGVDLWISINHNAVIQFMSDSIWTCDTVYFNCQDSSCIEWLEDSCIAWDYSDCEDTLIQCNWVNAGAVRLEGSILEDWDMVNATVYGSQRMMLQLFGMAIDDPQIPPGAGQYLLAKLAFEVTDSDGVGLDSLCNDSLLYEQFGVTPIHVEPITKFSDCEDGLIGWDWELFCVDSFCTEWDGETCIAWECTEWDSVYAVDTTAVYFCDGSVTLDCEEGCDLIIADADASGMIDIDDVVYLITYIFTGGFAPAPHAVASGDANCDCAVDIDDVVYLIAYIFVGGPLPQCTCEEWIDNCGALH
jgi:hypothetical protein